MIGKAIIGLFKGLFYIARATWPLMVTFWLIVPMTTGLLPESAKSSVEILGPALGVLAMFIWTLASPASRPLLVLAAGYAILDGLDVVLNIWNWPAKNHVPMSSIPVMSVVLAIIGMIAGIIGGVAAFPSLQAVFDERKGVKSRRSTSTLHGSADWVSVENIRKIAGRGGLILGQEDDDPNSRIVRYPLEGHGLTIAPTRSGKGVSFIIPNLLAPTCLDWDGPMVVIDPKAESVFITTKRRRELGRDVHVLDPFNIVDERLDAIKNTGTFVYVPPSSATYNPLDAIHRGDDMAADIATLIEALLPPPRGKASSGSGSDGDHFRLGAARMIAAGIAWVIRTEPRDMQHLGTVYDLIAGPNLDEIVQKWSESDIGTCRTASGLLLSVGDRERGSFISTATNALSWLEIPQLRRQIETSTCSLDEMIEGTADFFICVPPHRLEQAKIWLRIWATLPLAAALRRKPLKRVLLLVDEAPLIGRLDPILNAFRVAAGMNVSCWLISQSMADLSIEYGKEAFESLVANAEVISLFEVSHAAHETAEKISQMIGEATYLEETASDNHGNSAKATDFFGSVSTGSSSSRKEIKRRLILPDEIKAMKPNEILVLQRSKIAKGPMRLFQAKYYERPEMAKLASPNPYR
jgi:type IV secretion system protein VirD4